MSVRTVPAQKRVRLADCPYGCIVRVGDRWGVLVFVHELDGNLTRGRTLASVWKTDERVVDFWDGGREIVDGNEIVESLEMRPSLQGTAV